MIRQEDTLYEDHKRYRVSVIDMLTPDVPIFTCGLNDSVNEYPTKKEIELTGAQIKMLMTCAIPEPVTEIVDGLSVVRGFSEYPRFAITLRGLGQMPTERAVILGGKGASSRPTSVPPTPKAICRDAEDAVNAEVEASLMEEPGPDRAADLEGATTEELHAHAKGLGLSMSPRATRGALVKAILRAEEAAAESAITGE